MFRYDVLEHITACHPPKDALGVDICSWKLSTNRNFSIKLAYHSLVQDETSTEDTKWKHVWENSIPPRIKYFLWIVWKICLLTNSERVRQGMTEDSGCALCGAVTEFVSHVLRDCKFAKNVWLQLVSPDDVHMFFDYHMKEWLMNNLRGQLRMRISGAEVAIIFAVTCWLLWKQRNLFVFQQQLGSIEDIVKVAECMAVNIFEIKRR